MTGNNIKLVLNIDTPDYFQKTSNEGPNKRQLEKPFATISAKKPKLSKVAGKAIKRSNANAKIFGSSIGSINQKSKLNSNEKISQKTLNKKKQNLHVNLSNKKLKSSAVGKALRLSKANLSKSKSAQSLNEKLISSSKSSNSNIQSKQPKNSKGLQKPNKRVSFDYNVKVHSLDRSPSKGDGNEANDSQNVQSKPGQIESNDMANDLQNSKYIAAKNKVKKNIQAINSDKSIDKPNKSVSLPNKLRVPGKPQQPIASLFRKNPEIPQIEKKNKKEKGRPQELFSKLSFDDFEISHELVSNLEKLGYTKMTLVQQQSWPLILKGTDLLIKSQTGSGKTLAYALPIVDKLMRVEPKIKRTDGLFALIVVPSRELAVQTYQWFEKLCKSCVWIVPGYLIGGEKKKAEKARLRKGINVLIATPGRLIDHINNTSSLTFQKLQFLVLDEADRMLDMGYEQNVKSILFALDEVAEERQTILLSATLTSEVQKLAGITLKSPEIVDITSMADRKASNSSEATLSDQMLVTPQNLQNHFMLVPTKLRLVSLVAFIVAKCRFSDDRKMLIFMTTQDMVDYHTSLFSHVVTRLGKPNTSKTEKGAQMLLSGKREDIDLNDLDDDLSDLEDDSEEVEDKIEFMKLHGSMSQPERTAVFKSFHQSSSGVLLCTDVASRGIDLPFVDWIVQYNPAAEAADYVHRVGRTARADRGGSAVVFISPSETSYVDMLDSQGISFNELRMTDVLGTLLNSELYDRESEKLPSRMEIGATRLQDKFEIAVEEDSELKNMAIKGYTSFVRSYAAIPKKSRDHFCFKLLHLGHCAKSFALRDPPAVLGAKACKAAQIKAAKDESIAKKQNRYQNVRGVQSKQFFTSRTPISEFDSGLEQSNRQKKKSRKT